MKAGAYAVSVQWGVGRHYFIWTGDSLKVAEKTADDHKKLLAKRRDKGGLKPYVFVWNNVVLKQA